ncbi:hypothetical protein VXE69_29150 [Mycolicibacterium cosmeticum]
MLGELGQIVLQAGAQRVDGWARQLCAMPEVQYGGFDEMLAEIFQCAAVLASVAAVAEPIPVLCALLARGDSIGKAGVASSAVQRSGEVVLSAVGPFAGYAVSGQNVLHLVECGLVNERFMPAGVLDTFPGDDADVVAVSQDVVQLVGRKRSGDSSRGGPLDEPTGLQGTCKAVQAPVSSRILLKSPPDVGCAFWIYPNGASFAAVDDLADVEISDWCNGGGAAGRSFLAGAFTDFIGEVTAVEFCDAGHNPVQKNTTRCRVDVLGDADERASRCLYREVDLDVIGAIARQPIDLMHNNVGRGVLRDVGEQLL